jgi:hypothetical protein
MLSDLANEELESITPMIALGSKWKGEPSGRLYFQLASGWVIWISELPHQSFPLCWLPPDQRGKAFSSHQSTFAVASHITGQLTIIDFAPMLEMLRHTHVVA